MTRFRYILLSTLLMVVTPVIDANSQVQQAFWTISEQDGFPVFSSPHKTATFKVNLVTQASALNKILSPLTENPFDNMGQSSFNGYSITRNDSHILSFSIDLEGCGAYCESYQMYFSFSSETGDMFNLAALFSKDDFPTIRRTLVEERKKLLIETIEGIRQELTKTEADTVTLWEQRHMYEFCLTYQDENSIAGDSFYLTDSSALCIGSRCSNHAMRAIDDLYNLSNELVGKKIKSYLSEFGRYAFDMTHGNPIPNPSKVIYDGMIGKYPVWLVESIEDNGGYIRWSYCYKKYGKMIDLRREGENSNSFQEEDNIGNTYGKLVFDKKGDQLIGAYDDDNGNTLRFTASLLSMKR